MKKTYLSLALFVVSISLLLINPVAGIRTVAETLGHTFDEEAWAIEYDVLSHETTRDWTRGDHSDEVQPPIIDTSPIRDATFYTVYLNMGNVRTVFMALTNYSWNIYNPEAQGVAPYQILLQSYRAAGKTFVIIENVYAGMIAYQENASVANGVPDVNEAMYYGFSLNSEYHKALINGVLTSNGISPITRTPARVTPVNLTKEVVGEETVFKFGINYENMFVVWEDLNVETDLNATSMTGIDIVAKREALINHIVAFCAIKYINFTYTVKGIINDTGYQNVTTSTEYDIGEVTDLWIINDNAINALALSGNVYPNIVSGMNFVRYNTSIAIQNRIGGFESLKPFSLAMANYARATVIQLSTTTAEQALEDEEGQTVNGENADRNVTRMQYRIAKQLAYKVDFESKPDYIFNGSEVLPAPVKLYPNVRVRNPTLRTLDELAHRFIATHVSTAIKARIPADKNVEIDINQRSVFYAICFPKWGGETIWQDPTFIAYSVPEETTGKRIDGYLIGLVLVFGLGMAVYLIHHKKN